MHILTITQLQCSLNSKFAQLALAVCVLVVLVTLCHVTKYEPHDGH